MTGGISGYSFMPSATGSSDRLATASYYPDYGTSANQVMATLMARQAGSSAGLDSQQPQQQSVLGGSLLADQFLTQRALQGMSPATARNILSMSDQDFGQSF